MKRTHLLSLCAVLLLFLSGINNNIKAQTSTATVVYTGAQALGCCNVCGLDYWCINNTGGCGTSSLCSSQSFWDPVPAGYIVTNITLNFWSAQCSGGSITASVNSNVFPITYEGSTGCLCSSNPCGMTTSTTATYPCGISDYNYGSSAMNTLQLCTGTDVCMQRVELVMTYAPSDQSTPPTGTGTVNGNTFVCAGTSEVYTLNGGPFTGVASYNWTVPGGWTITAGQGTTSITVTAGSSSGQICCAPSNLCGSAGPFCLAVTGSALPLDPTATVDNNNFCAGSVANITLTAIGGSGTTLNWYSGSCGGTYIGSGVNITIPAPTTTTTYYAAWTATCGTSGCGSVTVNVNPLPAADAGTSPGTITCTTTQLTLSASGGTSYSWSASGGGNIVSGANTANPVVDAGGTYTVTVTDGNGCTGTDDVIVTQSTAVPVADAGTAPGMITCTTPSLTLAGSGGGNYSWSASGGGNIVSGGNTANPVVNAGGTYTVTVTDPSSGCTSTDDVIINQDITVPVADAGTVPGVITCSVTSLTLSGSGGGNYAWSASGGGNIISGINTANPVVDAGGTYTVTVTDPASGCTSTDDVIITANNSPPVANAGADVNVCQGTSTQLNASGGTSYAWSPTSTLDNPFISNPIATPTSTTTYTVTVTDVSNGCTASDDVIIGFSPPLNPVIIPSGQVGFCDSASVIVTLDAGGGYTSYYWSTNEVTQAIVVTQPGTYTVTVTDAMGCTGSSSGITVYVQPPSLNPVILAAGSSTFCKGDSVNLYLNDPFYTYVWSSGSTTPSIWAYQTNDYVVTVTDSLGCVYITPPYHVQVNPLPNAFASYSNTMLDVDFFDFSANVTSWNWDFGDGQTSTLTNPTHTYDSTGVYIAVLTVTNNCGSDSDTLTVTVPGYAGIVEDGGISNLLIYPVPAYQNVIVSFYLNNPSDFILNISDILGQTILSENVSNFSGQYSKNIDLSVCARGIYLLTIKSNDFIIIRKFSKD